MDFWFSIHNQTNSGSARMYVLKDKVVLVTGGSNGIGAEVVRELVQEEVKQVIVLDVDISAGVTLKNNLNQKHGDIVTFIKCDVADQEQLFAAFKQALEANDYIDLVINNAGVVDESNYSLIRKQIDINFTAVVNGTLKALEIMRIDKGGRGGTVINMSSIAALIKQSPLLFVYTATKSAIMQFSNCIGRAILFNNWCKSDNNMFREHKTTIFNNLNSFDDTINMKEIIGLFPMQTPVEAARGTIKAFKQGKSGSTWLINSSKPAVDITATVDKAYGDLTRLLQ